MTMFLKQQAQIEAGISQALRSLSEPIDEESSNKSVPEFEDSELTRSYSSVACNN